MLIRFEVENYGGFKDRFVFDLTTNKRYDYNQEMISKRTIMKSLVYGNNGSGKSSLSSAIMDITYHLVDKEKKIIPDDLYFYAGSNKHTAIFVYEFKFDKLIVKYEYAKSSQSVLCYEKLYYNDELKIEHNYIDASHCTYNLQDLSTLNIKGLPPQISAIKYIYNNTIQDAKSPLYKMIDYVSRMLSFKSMAEGNFYIGYSNGGSSLSSIIIKHNKLEDFKSFLCNQGLGYNITTYNDVNGNPNIGIKFENNKIIPFGSIISSGTKTIWLFYCWMLEFSHISLLVIDEFDAHYHYNTARSILRIINSYSNMQTIITTHNMMLMNNALTRPDCCFLLGNNQIRPLCKLTNREIREKNNLQKMYIDGIFSNYFDK